MMGELPRDCEVMAESNDDGLGLLHAFVSLDLIRRAEGGIVCVIAVVGPSKQGRIARKQVFA